MSAPEESRAGRRVRINFNTALGGGCVVLALLLFALIPSQVEEPKVLFGQSGVSLDPRVFPTLVATLLLIVGGLYVRESFRMQEHNGFATMSRHAWWNVAITLGLFLIYAAILKPLGFLLSSALIVAASSVFFGARHWPSVVLVAIGVPFAVYAVFRYGLAVSLPELPDF